MSTALAETRKLHSSFRDPDGFLFFKGPDLYRQVNQTYQKNYDLLMDSGLYATLLKASLLVPHEEVSDLLAPEPALAYKVIQPLRLPFISYPYEWSFSQLKDAALLTLEIQKEALNHGLTLKDCSAYNVQFLDGKPLFIDSLSFEAYQEGSPWNAYRQFCQHFLAPLALMRLTDIRLSQLLRVYIDGIPLDLASQLLPLKSRFNLALLIHIHFHAKTQKNYEDKPDAQASKAKVSKMAMAGLIDNLETAIRKMEWVPSGTEWGNYYQNTNYTGDAFQQKRKLVADFIQLLAPKTVWDLGGNMGEFSRVASEQDIFTVSFDIDPAAVEKNYRLIQKTQDKNLLPLILDLTNPSPGIGWGNMERDSVSQRGPVDTAMALALIHHLAISNNLPLEKIAAWLSQICRSLIIEFVPKADSQVKKLLSTRVDIFQNYTQNGFEAAFSQYFIIKAQVPIQGSERTLYAMQARRSE